MSVPMELRIGASNGIGVLDDAPQDVESFAAVDDDAALVDSRCHLAPANRAADAEEALVLDVRAHLRPAEFVDSRVHALLRTTVVPLSRVPTAGMTRRRG
jgi:hypothetical protein